MNEEKRHFDENSDLRISDKFSADLKSLFKPQGSVPPEVDRAVMDRASQHFVRRRPHLVLRWAVSVSAVAAAVFIVAILNITYRPALQKATRSHEAGEYAKEVRRMPGRGIAKAPDAELKSEPVTIKLTAENFRESDPVARRSLIATERDDFDRNGRVDILDAFKLAKSFEASNQLDNKWDLNGDGIINRSDIDSIAYTAVRLDKGVL